MEDLYPRPWSYDVSPQEPPPSRRSVKVYSADSFLICETKGEYAEALARLIVESVNSHEEGHKPSDLP